MDIQIRYNPLGLMNANKSVFGVNLGHMWNERNKIISIPVINTSVNPARSTGVALYVGGWAISQLWLFWVAPIIGAVLGGIAYRFLGSNGE